MTTKEKREVKISWCRQIATILHKILDQYELDEWCKNVKRENEGSNTAYNYIELRYEIRELSKTLSQMAKYMEIINKAEEKQ